MPDNKPSAGAVEADLWRQDVYEEIRKELGFLGMPDGEEETEKLARAFVAARIRLAELQRQLIESSTHAGELRAVLEEVRSDMARALIQNVIWPDTKRRIDEVLAKVPR
jgi:hypothetical protein